jgi:hypothetical protein
MLPEVFASPRAAVMPREPVRRTTGTATALDMELDATCAAVTEVTGLCADALAKAARHFRGDDAWVIGTMPNCLGAIDAAEARVKRVLANSHMETIQVDTVSAHLKALADLRTAARAARQAVQLAWLLRQAGAQADAFPLVRPIADHACMLAVETARALENGDLRAARTAALEYRTVGAACNEAERSLIAAAPDVLLNPLGRRLSRSAIWFMAVGGECFARIAARSAAASSVRI